MIWLTYECYLGGNKILNVLILRVTLMYSNGYCRVTLFGNLYVTASKCNYTRVEVKVEIWSLKTLRSYAAIIWKIITFSFKKVFLAPTGAPGTKSFLKTEKNHNSYMIWKNAKNYLWYCKWWLNKHLIWIWSLYT